mmetsp:Transcript_44767/g.117413  ORF Transcript_44767/g.117413 Transcript_44767/m.117413 type:complete len:836 (+) Transcript_44767:25-2532(+)
MSGPGAPSAPVQLNSDDHVIIVAYHLPLTVARTGNGSYAIEWDDERGIDSAGMGLPSKITYVGCIELEVTDLAEQERLEKLLLQDYNSVVLFLDHDLKQLYYHRFCRLYLAPIMHNQMHVIEDVDPFQPDEWRAYCTVNQLFANKVMENYSGSGSEMIWIHDYHLMLTPSCIVRKLPLAKLGFFMHSPFPASDVWRTVAVRLELLRSMLNVDLVGFLMFEYGRNFLTCCKRMLALEYEFQKGGFLGIEYEGRHVMLQICTFGISPPKVDARIKAPSFSAVPVGDDMTLWDVCSSGKLVIGAIDYLDRLKGVAPKLLAWEALLRDYPHYRKGHCLVQVCVGARNRIQIATAPAVETELRSIVDRINRAFPGTVHFEVRSHMTSTERLWLWCATQVLLVTSLREAINCSPLEFVLARHLRGLPPGVAILSEFTGFSRVLNGCLRINPNAMTEVVETLDQALQMRVEERSARAAKDLAHILRCTNQAFATTFLTELKSTMAKKEEDFVRVGFGHAKFRLVGMGSGFKPLDTSEAIEAFQKAKRRVLLLDWGGTIVPSSTNFYDERDSTGCQLPQNVIEALATLSDHPSCHVMIMSGLSKEKVLSAFGTVPNLSLAVEHGYQFRVRGGAWQQPVKTDNSWRSVVQSMMDVYVSRTHGAFVQQKGSSIVFNYGESDPEFGAMSGKELQVALQQMLVSFPVVIRTGKGYVEACHEDVNKGAMAKLMIETLEADGEPVDFVLCAGDDSTDELMFGALHEKLGKANPALFTVTIGRKPSEASRYLDDHREVVNLLELLCSIGFRPPGKALGASGGGGGMGMGMKKGGGLGSMSSSFHDLASLA